MKEVMSMPIGYQRDAFGDLIAKWEVGWVDRDEV